MPRQLPPITPASAAAAARALAARPCEICGDFRRREIEEAIVLKSAAAVSSEYLLPLRDVRRHTQDHMDLRNIVETLEERVANLTHRLEVDVDLALIAGDRKSAYQGMAVLTKMLETLAKLQQAPGFKDPSAAKQIFAPSISFNTAPAVAQTQTVPTLLLPAQVEFLPEPDSPDSTS